MKNKLLFSIIILFIAGFCAPAQDNISTIGKFSEIKNHTVERRNKITQNDKDGFIYIGSFEGNNDDGFKDVFVFIEKFEPQTEYLILICTNRESYGFSRRYTPYIIVCDNDLLKKCMSETRNMFIKWSEVVSKERIKSFEKIMPVYFHGYTRYEFDVLEIMNNSENPALSGHATIYFPRFRIDEVGKVSLELDYALIEEKFRVMETNSLSEHIVRYAKPYDKVRDDQYKDYTSFGTADWPDGFYYIEGLKDRPFKIAETSITFSSIEEFDLLYNLLDTELIQKRISEVLSVINAEKEAENNINALFQ